MVKGNEFEDTIKMEIENVITPAERIRMYQEKFSVLGSCDIALIRTSEPITFILGKVSPVDTLKIIRDLLMSY